MLPTIPKIEDFRRKACLELVKKTAEKLTGILALVDTHVQFEGAQSEIIRHDDTVGETPLHAVTGEAVFPRVALVDFTEEKLVQQLVQVAEQLAREMSEHLFSDLDRAISEVGNVIEAGGKPISKGLILQMMETIEHRFEPDGTWMPPTVIASSQAIDRLMESGSADGFGSTEFNESLKAIVDKKRDDFRRREADRVLAG